MHVHTVRTILDNRSDEVSAGYKKWRDRGLNDVEIAVIDPYLAGQAYMLAMIGLDWAIADV